MSEKKPEIVFAPGCFDNFDGTQEELQDMSAKELSKEFEIKDFVSVMGVTEDFVWYETDRLMRDMMMWQSRFRRMSETMENRHKEHLKIIDGLLHEVKKLKEELAKERQ